MNPLPATIEIDEDLLYLFGWYLAEGYATDKNKSREVSLSGNKGERLILERLATKLRAFGIKSTIREKGNRNAIELRACNNELAEWFSTWLGRTCKEKHLPEILRRLPPEQTKFILQGYIDGDGENKPECKKWVTASQALVTHISEMAVICGYSPGIHNRVNEFGTRMWHGRFATGGSPRGGSDENYIYYLVSEVKSHIPKRRSKPRVFDLTVEEDHSFVTGFASVHNCHRIGQRDSVLVQHLVLEGSLDAKMAVTLVEKLDIIDKALNQSEEVSGQHNHSMNKERYEQLMEVPAIPIREVPGLFDAI